jgi:hypothetical protein
MCSAGGFITQKDVHFIDALNSDAVQAFPIQAPPLVVHPPPVPPPLLGPLPPGPPLAAPLITLSLLNPRPLPVLKSYGPAITRPIPLQRKTNGL